MTDGRFFEWVTLTPRPGAMHTALSRLAERATGPDLLGCWFTVLGQVPRIQMLRRAPAQTDHAAARRRAIANEDVFGAADLMQEMSAAVYASLPCMPDVTIGAFGSIYEIRTYELHPGDALQAAIDGWAAVIGVRLPLAPINAVIHSVNGTVPRLVHIYAYSSLAHRIDIREQATATGKWPPKGGAVRNRVMATEIAIPADFSPIH